MIVKNYSPVLPRIVSLAGDLASSVSSKKAFDLARSISPEITLAGDIARSVSPKPARSIPSRIILSKAQEIAQRGETTLTRLIRPLWFQASIRRNAKNILSYYDVLNSYANKLANAKKAAMEAAKKASGEIFEKADWKAAMEASDKAGYGSFNDSI